MARDELANQLKSQTLDEVKPSAFKQVGGVVYPDAGTRTELDNYRQVVESYQAVHLPTYGNLPIDSSTSMDSITQLSTKSSAVLAQADTNEVLEIVGIAVRTTSNYETSGAELQIISGFDTHAVIDLSYFDTASASTSGVIYGSVVKVATDTYITPNKLLLNGGETLQIATAASPNDDIIYNITTRKYMQ